jgi:predicted amidophosphoribosyltransferase
MRTPCQFHRGQAVTAGLSLAIYADNFRPVLWAAKFKRNRLLAELLGRTLAHAVKQTGWKIELVTFVPSHWLNQIRRGYVLSELCARTVATQLKLPLSRVLVSRTRASQVGLARRKRLENPTKRFALREGVPHSVILIDDIRTTGATLERCAALLREGGARRVYTATIFAENMR